MALLLNVVTSRVLKRSINPISHANPAYSQKIRIYNYSQSLSLYTSMLCPVKYRLTS
jgi:hypothetical protein